MILIRRLRAVVALVSVAVVVLSLGIFAYQAVMGAAADVPALKSAAERVLFVATVGVVFVSLVCVWAAGDHIRVRRELDRARSVIRREGVLPETALRRLGGLGDDIGRLVDALVEKNGALRMKVDSQRQLLEFAFKNLQQQCCVCDISGRVAYVTSSLVRQQKESVGDLVGKSIVEITGALDLPAVLRAVDQTGEPFKDAEGRMFYGITDSRGVVTYLVYLKDGKGLEAHAAARQKTQPRRGFLDLTRRFFGRSAG